MARIRTVKPDFWRDQELALLSRDARLFYIGLWNFADDDGRVIGDPAYLKGQIFPYDEDARVEVYLEELRSQDKIVQYTSDKGEKFIHVVRLNKHQKIDKRYPSTLPAPPPPTPRKNVPAELRCQLATKYGAAWGKKAVKVKCALCPTMGEVEFLTRRWPGFLWLEIDHIKPLAAGGQTVIENLQLLCKPCNRHKSCKYTPNPSESTPIPPERSAGAAECPPPYMEGEREGERERRGGGEEGSTPPRLGGQDAANGGTTAGENGPTLDDLVDATRTADDTIPEDRARFHIRQALERGVKPAEALSAIKARAASEKLWHILDGLPPLRTPLRRLETYRGPEATPKGPSSADVQKQRDDALIAVEQKLSELDPGTVEVWRKDAEAAARAAKVPDDRIPGYVQSTIRVRAAKAFGIKGL